MFERNTGDLGSIIALIKAGNKSEARSLLIAYLRNNPQNEQAWLYMAACATTKSEFERSIQQVLRLNPYNEQALDQATKYDIPLPDQAAGQAKKGGQRKKQAASEKSGAKADRPRSGRRLRILLMLLIMLILVGAAGYYVQSQDDDSAEVEVSDPEALSTTEPDPEADLEPEPTIEATATPQPSPTPQPETEPEPTQETEPQTEVEPDITFNISADPAEYFQGWALQADNAPANPENIYPSDANLSLVLNLAEHGEPLNLNLVVREQASNESFNLQQDLAIGAAQQVTFLLRPPAANPTWPNGLWIVELSINELNVSSLQFFIEEALEVALVPTDTPQPEPTNTPEPAPTDAPETETEAEATPIQPSATPSVTPEPQPTETPSPTLLADTAPDIQETSAPGWNVPGASSIPPTRPPRIIPTIPPTPGESDEGDNETDTEGELLPTGEETLRLVYDPESLYIINISEDNQNISLLSFQQSIGAGTVYTFPTTAWQEGTFRGVGSIYALQPNSCFKTGINIGATSITPAECIRLSAWRVANLNAQFWLINDGNVRSFNVLWDGERIAECEIDAGECLFGLPEIDS